MEEISRRKSGHLAKLVRQRRAARFSEQLDISDRRDNRQNPKCTHSPVLASGFLKHCRPFTYAVKRISLCVNYALPWSMSFSVLISVMNTTQDRSVKLCRIGIEHFQRPHHIVRVN